MPPLWDVKSFTIVVAAQASTPAQLNASVLSNGDVRLVWTTTPGRTYVLQRSADLANWQDLITLNAVGDSLEHIDAATPAAPMRFYRVVQR